MTDQIQVWFDLSARLGIEVVAPCDIQLEGGGRIRATAHIPNFGGTNGMLVDPDFAVFAPHSAALASSGYGYSVVELSDQWDRAPVIEMLVDWGWSSPHPRPQWLLSSGPS